MLINLFGNWINPLNIIAIVDAKDGAGSKVVFNNGTDKGFQIEFLDKAATVVATEINTAIAANRKPAFDRKSGGDRGGFKGGFKGGRGGDRDRGGDRGDRGDRGGFKKKFDKPAEYGSDEHKEKVRGDFSKRKEGGGKFEPRSRSGDFKPKKRKEW